jgi:hypothetical protein
MTAQEGVQMWEDSLEDLWATLIASVEPKLFPDLDADIADDRAALLEAARRLRDVEAFLLCDAGIAFPTETLPPGKKKFREKMLEIVEQEV